MTEEQIEIMLSEIKLSNYESQPNISFKIPELNDLRELSTTTSYPHTQQKRTNQQLVRSILYMGYLLRGDKERSNKANDVLIDSLETITSVLDNLYLLTKFGIGKQSKMLQSLSSHASKIWFVTLLFSLKKLIGNIIRLARLRTTVLKEIKKCQLNQNNKALTSIIIQRYEMKMDEIKREITMDGIELLGTLNDLLFVSLELFKFNINPKVEKLLGFISAGMSLYRISNTRSG